MVRNRTTGYSVAQMESMPKVDPTTLLRVRLVEMIDMRNKIVKLSGLIDREILETGQIRFFPSHTACPAISPRPVGLTYQ